MEDTKKPKVKLTRKDCNASILLAQVRKALREAGMSDKIEEFTTEATSKGYDHLVATCHKYCDIE